MMIGILRLVCTIISELDTHTFEECHSPETNRFADNTVKPSEVITSNSIVPSSSPALTPVQDVSKVTPLYGNKYVRTFEIVAVPIEADLTSFPHILKIG